MPSNHISNQPYHEWLAEKYKGLKADRDECVVCGIETKWPAGLDVELRSHYTEGIGQRCERCYVEEKFPLPPHPD